jgi:hypothetical protein
VLALVARTSPEVRDWQEAVSTMLTMRPVSGSIKRNGMIVFIRKIESRFR